jgi:hypothetical protein
MPRWRGEAVLKLAEVWMVRLAGKKRAGEAIPRP